MSGDLFTLRMMVVGDRDEHRQIWRDAARLASVPIDFKEADGANNSGTFADGGLDIVVFDGDLNDCNDAIQAARALTPRPIITVAATSPDKIDGADAFVHKPPTKDDARALLERCINMRVPRRVLVVDDSTTMRAIVRKILSASRYALEVSEADEGLAALKNIDNGVAIVLLDYNMPGFNGFETLAEIKRLASHVNVVMMTSTENEALVAKAETSGAAGFLRKPFYPADIDAVLDTIYAAPPAR